MESENAPNERFVIAEDVVTRGGRVQETVDNIRAHGGEVVGVGVTVDRSGRQHPDFGCPFFSLVEMNVSGGDSGDQTWEQVTPAHLRAAAFPVGSQL